MRRLFSSVIVILLASAAQAQSRDDIWMLCTDDDPNVSIAGCTQFIQQDQSADDLAVAYYNRGTAYRALGQNEPAIADYDRAIRLNPGYARAYNNRGVAHRTLGQNAEAIADYDEAIKLNPSFAQTFGNRGIVYRALGQYDRAVADFDQAIAVSPNYAVAFYNRGVTYFYLGQFTSAADDLAQSVKLNPADAYAVLWLHLARGKTGAADAEEFSGNAAGINPAKWPGAVLKWHLGTGTAEEVRADAAQGDAKARTGQACEAAFYGGELDLLRHDPAAARTLLLEATNICPQNFEEYLGAVAELKRVP